MTEADADAIIAKRPQYLERRGPGRQVRHDRLAAPDEHAPCQTAPGAGAVHHRPDAGVPRAVDRLLRRRRADGPRGGGDRHEPGQAADRVLPRPDRPGTVDRPTEFEQIRAESWPSCVNDTGYPGRTRSPSLSRFLAIDADTGGPRRRGHCPRRHGPPRKGRHRSAGRGPHAGQRRRPRPATPRRPQGRRHRSRARPSPPSAAIGSSSRTSRSRKCPPARSRPSSASRRART